jgi:threonine/homoserine efflux transporter RhtA
MHCGAEFDEPLDAETGQTLDSPGYGGASEAATGSNRSDTSIKAIAVALSVAAFVTIPLVAPANVTLLYLIAVVGVGFYANSQTTASDATQRGLRALAVAPLGIWMASPLVTGFEAFSPFGVFLPAVYAAVVLWIRKEIDSND